MKRKLSIFPKLVILTGLIMTLVIAEDASVNPLKALTRLLSEDLGDLNFEAIKSTTNEMTVMFQEIKSHYQNRKELLKSITRIDMEYKEVNG